MAGPLAGIRVLELGQLIAAPFAARLMAEFGAEVMPAGAVVPATGDGRFEAAPAAGAPRQTAKNVPA